MKSGVEAVGEAAVVVAEAGEVASPPRPIRSIGSMCPSPTPMSCSSQPVRLPTMMKSGVEEAEEAVEEGGGGGGGGCG